MESHTRLGFRGFLDASAKTARALIAVLLSITLFGLVSCSNDSQDASLATQPVLNDPGNHHADNGKQSNHRIADWTEAGLLHNGAIRLIDDSIAVEWPNRFSSAEAYSIWIQDTLLKDYATTALGLSSEKDAIVRAQFWEIAPDEDLNFNSTGFGDLLYDMVEEELISQREADFMQRWWNIKEQIAENCDFEEIQDSLVDWKGDILAINWDGNEECITTFMSIAYYSFDFWLNEGFDDTDSGYNGENVLINIDDESVVYVVDPWTLDCAAYAWALRHMYSPIIPLPIGKWNMSMVENFANRISTSGYWPS